MRAPRRLPEVDAYLARLPLPARVLADELRALVHRHAPGAREAIRYGVPFFLLGDEPLCYVSAARTHVTFGFAQGDRIADASGRLVGTGRSPIRKATLALDEPVPPEAAAWVAQAAALARRAPTAGRPPRGAGSSSRTPPRGARRSTRSP